MKIDKDKKLITILGFGILGFWFLSILWFTIFLRNYSWSDRGSIGDTFGAINSVFSGFALIAVIYTVYVQLKEINENKLELEIQKFENRFFNLLKVHNDIIEGIEDYQRNFKGDTVYVRGRGKLKQIFEEFKKGYEQPRKDAQNPIELIDRVYTSFYANNHQYLGHYFRHLYHIIAFVEGSNLDFEKKKEYVKLVRAQLSSYELGLLFYNCLSNYGINKFKPLIEKYSLLEHTKKISNVILEQDKSLYNESAFKEII